MTSKQHIAVGLIVAVSVSFAWAVLLALADRLGMDARGIGAASVYFVTIGWAFMACGAFVECDLERRQDVKELARARALQLYVLIRQAVSNHERALLMEAQGTMKVLAALAAGYLLYRIGPSLDYSPGQMALRLFFMLDIYWFWQTKRKDRARRRNMPVADLARAKEQEEEDGALAVERARDEVTTEIRENRRLFAEFGQLVMDRLDAIEKRLNGSR